MKRRGCGGRRATRREEDREISQFGREGWRVLVKRRRSERERASGVVERAVDTCERAYLKQWLSETLSNAQSSFVTFFEFACVGPIHSWLRQRRRSLSWGPQVRVYQLAHAIILWFRVDGLCFYYFMLKTKYKIEYEFHFYLGLMHALFG